MMNKLQSVCFLLVLFLTANVNAQSTDTGNWFLYLATKKSTTDGIGTMKCNIETIISPGISNNYC